MNKSLRIVLGVVIIVLGISLLFSKFSPFTSQHDDSKSVSLEGIKRIEIKGSSEDINIIRSHENALSANMTATTKGFLVSNPKLDIRKSGSTLKIEVKRSFIQVFSFSDIELDIYINEAYNKDLYLNLSSGNLNLDDAFTVDTLDVNLSSGDIRIQEIATNDTKIKVSSGSLEIKSFTGNIEGEISSGDVEIDYLTFDNDIEFSASSGSVEIRLPDDANFDFKGSKSSGDIDIDFKLDDYSDQNDTIKGRVGSGGNTIDLDVSSGQISIEKK